MTDEEKNILELERRFVGLLQKRPRSPSEAEEMERYEEALIEALKRQAKDLFDEVLEAGIRIKSVWDFVNTADKYPEAIPVLVKHLNRSYHHRTKEGIVRALAVREAKGIANKAVMEEYHRLPKEDPEIDPDEQWIYHYRWAFGNTMTVIVTKDDLEALIDIVTDESNGQSRSGFIEALAKLKSPKVIEVLHQLEKDKNQVVAELAKKILARNARANERKTKSR